MPQQSDDPRDLFSFLSDPSVDEPGFAVPEEALPEAGAPPVAPSTLEFEPPRLVPPDPLLVAFHDQRSPATEQYRALRTNLLAMDAGDPPRAFVITSATKGEGKTVTTSNLATVLAEIPSTRVLVVDCDLRNPSVHRMVGVEAGPGLGEYLRNEIDIQAAITPTSVPGVDLVQAGEIAGAPLELFASRSIQELLRTLRAAYDFVLFDTPPVFALTDAAVVGAQCDGALFVVRRHGPPRDVVERAIHSLRSARTRVLGCTMTGVAPDRKYGRYPYPDEDDD